MRQAQPAAVTAAAAVAAAPGISPTGVHNGACPLTLVPAPALRSLVAAYAVREHVGASQASCWVPANCWVPVLAAHVAFSGGLRIVWGAGKVQAPQIAVKYCNYRHGTLWPPQRPGCPHRQIRAGRRLAVAIRHPEPQLQHPLQAVGPWGLLAPATSHRDALDPAGTQTPAVSGLDALGSWLQLEVLGSGRGSMTGSGSDSRQFL